MVDESDVLWIKAVCVGSCNDDGDGTSKRHQKFGVENNTGVVGQSIAAKAMVAQHS
jgi:hypothetical protein